MENISSACDVIAKLMNCTGVDDDSKESCKTMFKKNTSNCETKNNSTVAGIDEEKLSVRGIGNWDSCSSFTERMTRAIIGDFTYRRDTNLDTFRYKTVYHIPGNWLSVCKSYVDLNNITVDDPDNTKRKVNCKMVNNTIICYVNAKEMINKVVPKYYYDGENDAEATLKAAVEYTTKLEKKYPNYAHYRVGKGW